MTKQANNTHCNYDSVKISLPVELERDLQIVARRNQMTVEQQILTFIQDWLAAYEKNPAMLQAIQKK